MKLKYYLRGLGIGIITATVVFMAASFGKETELSDAEIIERAKSLGMVMSNENDTLADAAAQPTEDFSQNNAMQETEQKQDTQQKNTEQIVSTEQIENTETTQDTEEIDTDADENSNMQIKPEDDTQEQIPQESESEEEIEAEEGIYILVVEDGDICSAICDRLKENGVIDSTSKFIAFLREHDYSKSIGAGSYKIPVDSTYEEVLEILKHGRM